MCFLAVLLCVFLSADDPGLCSCSAPPCCGALAVTVTVAWDRIWTNGDAEPLPFGTSMLNPAPAPSGVDQYLMWNLQRLT